MLVAIGLVAGLAVAALASSARAVPQPLVGATAEILVQVTSDGRQLAGQHDPSRRLLVAGELQRARLGPTTWQLDLPVRLIVPEDRWRACSGCTPGALVVLHARVEDRGALDPAALLGSVSTPRVERGPEGLAAWAAGVRADLRDLLADRPADAASLVSGLTLGDESQQSPEFAATMRDAGLSHLTAVSGGNIVVVLVLALGPLRLLRVPVPGQVAGCGATLAAYVALVGPQPSVLRAAVMASAGLLGVLLGGPTRGFPVLFGCTFGLLLFAPELAVSLGFALSVAATAGLQVIAPPLARRLRRVLPGWLALAVAVTVAAQAATAPILLTVGSPVGWAAVPANIATAPLVAPITALGVLAALLATVATDAAAVLATAAAVLAELLGHVAETAAAAAAAPWSSAVTQWLVAAGVAGVLVRVTMVVWPGRWRLPASALVLCVGGWTALAPWRGPGIPPDWRVVACDVGQGTAILLRTSDAAILVDTGPKESGVVACLHDAGVRRLDAVVVTHHHADHVGSLAVVLDAVPVGAVVVGPTEHPREGAVAVAGESHRHSLAPVVVAAGDQLSWPGLDVTVLWPRPGWRGSADDVNNGSLVLLGRWVDGGSVLVPGDVEPESQSGLMAQHASPAADVVVVPHHGSDHQDPRFASWAAPLAAVASAGQDNSYGHPNPATLAEYTAAGAAVQRTDIDGPVAYSWRDARLVVTS